MPGTMPGTMIVTGGSRGIGAAVARLAAQRGHAVCVNYKADSGAAEALVEEITGQGGRAIAQQADVADEAAVEALFARSEKDLGPVTALVNNAGITGRISRFEAVETETLRRVLDVNVLGLMLCARAAVRRMSPKHGGSGGVIVNISSAAVTLGSPGEYVWYAASKGAVDSLTIGLARELAREDIRVNAVAPGTVETEIHATGGDAGRVERISPNIPLGRAGSPEEIAGPVLWLFSEEARFVTGEILRVSGGR